MRVAARAHRNQHRKASDLPYITHPASVALILVRAGFTDEALLAAALLHDVVEDTSYGAEILAAEFPPLVAEYVAALSERKLDDSGRKRAWRDRKLEHLEEVAHAPLPVRAIVLADKLHNLGTMLFDLEAGETLWERFTSSPADMVWYHTEMIAAAAGGDAALAPLANECREMLARVARHVP
ncbi:MAG TPA: HD domain-containing protein [Planctomycetaceae bacterium]|nr:HD domain-containing protein [Planctomycetaceae bacterium]